MAFLIDTNVLSEIRKKSADSNVLRWQNKHDLADSWVSVLTLMEIRSGTERVRHTEPAFAQKLDAWYHEVLLNAYDGRILAVSSAICEIRAALGAGRTQPEIDALIAATAKYHNLVLVTRNTKDFQDLGIKLLNPWEAN